MQKVSALYKSNNYESKNIFTPIRSCERVYFLFTN